MFSKKPTSEKKMALPFINFLIRIYNIIKFAFCNQIGIFIC